MNPLEIQRSRTSAGFSLVELLVVLAVIGVLGGIILGVTRSVDEKGKTNRALADMAMLSQALEQYKSHYGDYPWIDNHSETAVERSRQLFQALVGLRGPQGDDLSTRERVFINADDFELANANPTLSQEQLAEDRESYILDPWGVPYEYFYKSRSSWNQGAAPGAQHTWEVATFLLFSKGPDREMGNVEATGHLDRSAAFNNDNIYLQR